MIKKTSIAFLVALFLLGGYALPVRAQDVNMTLGQLVELLISVGVINPAKASLARAVVAGISIPTAPASTQTISSIVPATPKSAVVRTMVVSGGGGGGSSSSAPASPGLWLAIEGGQNICNTYLFFPVDKTSLDVTFTNTSSNPGYGEATYYSTDATDSSYVRSSVAPRIYVAPTLTLSPVTTEVVPTSSNDATNSANSTVEETQTITSESNQSIAPVSTDGDSSTSAQITSQEPEGAQEVPPSLE